MTRRILRHDAAERDLADHVERIARNSPQAARRFVQAVEEGLQLLADMPGLGSPCELRNPAAGDLRFWIVRGFPNHLVIYRPLADGIAVVRVFYGAQDWQAIFEK
jgi:plasmid stabilization system protein ParE